MAGIELLAELFPAAFFVYERRRRPLKVGIASDIAALLSGALTREELSLTLRCYTLNIGYLEKMLAGAWRYDLDGKPCGAVTKDEELKAKAELARFRARREARRLASAAAKRSSLADLRAAALRRKQTEAAP